MKKKILISSILISGAAMLASCSDSSTDSELRIVEGCNTANESCTVELTEAVVNLQTNFLGKTTEHLVKQTPLQAIEGKIKWETDGTVDADNEICVDADCSINTNPSAFSFAAGPHTIGVSGTVTVNGKSINLAEAVPEVSIVTEATADSHKFKWASTPELPASQTLQNVVDALNANKATAHGEFSLDGDSWKITCDAGYEWLDDQDPEWGEMQSSLEGRSVAVSQWMVNNWEVFGSEDAFTYNGAFDGELFIAGCWQEQP